LDEKYNIEQNFWTKTQSQQEACTSFRTAQFFEISHFLCSFSRRNKRKQKAEAEKMMKFEED